MTEEAQKLIKIIRQMEHSLDDSRPDDEYADEHDNLKVTFPLHNCIQQLARIPLLTLRALCH